MWCGGNSVGSDYSLSWYVLLGMDTIFKKSESVSDWVSESVYWENYVKVVEVNIIKSTK